MKLLNPEYHYEKRIIDSILDCIKDNQVYLTQPENLPQLAKLGYMYNTLWYGGRHASYQGVIPKVKYHDEHDDESYECDQCDDNPKYKIEMCNPENSVIENYIYDAWGMHVSNGYGPDWNEFRKIVLEGEELKDIDKKMLKPQKTFDEWVEALTDPNYRYSSMYKTRKDVANHLLCVIGNGYGFKDGYVFHESGGADQDSTDYGDWKNCTFREDINQLVNEIMEDDEVKKVLESIGEGKKALAEKERKEKLDRLNDFKSIFTVEEFNNLKEKIEDSNLYGLINDILERKLNKKAKPKKYSAYYPICNYSIITMFDNDTHPSYIKAAVEICEEILENREKELEQNNTNVKFAERFLKKLKNNFEEIEEIITLSDEELKTKIQQVKSSFSVEGLPLIKSDRFTQEEYDVMKNKTNAHLSHSMHLKVGAKVWNDEEIGEQIKTRILQKQVTEHELNKFIKNIKTKLNYNDTEEDKIALKKEICQYLGWDKLTPLDPNFWSRFGSAPYSMKHKHNNIGDVEKAYGAVGMEDIFGDSFGTTYHLTYWVNNI